METAPLFSDVADGPEGGRAYWLTASDGVRIRIGIWGQNAPKGTVLLFPGRTEYVEKYGRAARTFQDCGFATLSVDWRGQGLADRLENDVMSGHVHHFADYQRDVKALSAAAEALDLPKPWRLLGHSMGGCIALRAAMEGLPVTSCVFSAPMWGINISTIMRPLAWSMSWASRHLGFGHIYTPGTKPANYVQIEPFETNQLTGDKDMYQYMVGQIAAHPELGLGGPSLRWLNEALIETRRLDRRPSPSLPCLTFLGTDEDIVDPDRIHSRMSRWPEGKLDIVTGGRHEVMMETPQIREQVFNACCAFFDAH